MVRADGDHFKVSSNNAFNRLIVWITAKFQPSSQIRQNTQARELFIAAIGDRYGPEGREAARGVLGTNSRTPLRSRDISRIFATLDKMGPGQPPLGGQPSAIRPANVSGFEAPPAGRPATPAPVEPAAASPEAPIEPAPLGRPAGEAPAFRLQVDPQADQRYVNANSPDPLPAGGLFYRELQDGSTGLCGMHALNAFCGGPVFSGDGYTRTNVETALDMFDLKGEEREQTRLAIGTEVSTDPDIFKPMLAQLAENGRLDPACAHAEVEKGLNLTDLAGSPEERARINAFPGDRLMVGYSEGHNGNPHLVALRRESDGHWQVLNSLKASRVAPQRFGNLADYLLSLQKGVNIVHLEEGFRFAADAAAPGAGAAVHVAAAPEPESPDAPAGPMGPTGLDAQGEAKADPRLEPYLQAGLRPEVASTFLTAGIAPDDAIPFIETVSGLGDDPLEVLRSGIPTETVVSVYEHGLDFRAAKLIHAAGLDPGEAGPFLEDIGVAKDKPEEVFGSDVPIATVMSVYKHGLTFRAAELLHASGMSPADAGTFLEHIRAAKDKPEEVFGSGVPIATVVSAYKHGLDLRAAQLIHAAGLAPDEADGFLEYMTTVQDKPAEVFGPGVPILTVVSVYEHGLTFRAAELLHAGGITPAEAGPFLELVSAHGDDPMEVLESGIPPKKMRRVYNYGFSFRAAQMLQDGNLPARALRDYYTTHAIPFVDDTMIRYTNRHVTASLVAVGSGAFNTVYAVEHNDGVSRIFKPLAPRDPSRQKPVENGWAADRTGIDPYNPQTAMRNIATCRLAETLGFDVVVRTQLGAHSTPGSDPKQPPPLGLVMERAPGKAAYEYATDPDVFQLPDVRRELTKLQLLDCLTAQGDRHWGNYFIDVRQDGGVRVAGVDNDQCLGRNVHDPDMIRRGLHNTPDHGFRSCGLPPVIDRDMAQALENLTPEKVEELVDDGLWPEEVDAIKDRLANIKQHVQRLEQQRRIIEPDAWGSLAATEAADFTNSYFARESAMSLGWQAYHDEARVLQEMGYY